MTWIDADSDPATFDSSSADLVMPAGAKVLFAGLYFGGKLTPGTGGSPAKNAVREQHGQVQSSGRRDLHDADRPSTGRHVVDAVPGVRRRHLDRRERGRGNLLDRRRAARHREERRAVRRLGARRRLRRPGRAEPQPVDLRRDADRQRAATVTIPLSGFQTPLSGPVTSTVGIVAYEGDLGTNGDGAAIQGASGAFTALSNAVNPGPPATSASNSNVFNSTISNAGALVTSRDAELPEQPRLRRRPVQDDERARQRADEHAGAAVDQRRRLPAGCGDDRDRPVRAPDRRDEDRRSTPRRTSATR